MPSDTDIAIIGAGAAGLAAGIFAAETNPNLSVPFWTVLKLSGAKILVSGGGRCNVTNQRVTASDFHGNRKLIDQFFDASTNRPPFDGLVLWGSR
ncbi:MAG: NAD(P)/FAD-dependent oxidoreductase [Nitrospirales bacterium]